MVTRQIKYFYSFFSNLIEVLFSKNFIFLTLIGNAFIVLVACLFYNLEKNINTDLKNFIDALWFTFATVTTVGYGDITPKTDVGKLLGIFMMLLGSAIFATFTALFANSLLGQRFEKFHRDVNRETKRLNMIGQQIDLEEEQLQHLLQQLQDMIHQLEKRK